MTYAPPWSGGSHAPGAGQFANCNRFHRTLSYCTSLQPQSSQEIQQLQKHDKYMSNLFTECAGVHPSRKDLTFDPQSEKTSWTALCALVHVFSVFKCVDDGQSLLPAAIDIIWVYLDFSVAAVLRLFEDPKGV